MWLRAKASGSGSWLALAGQFWLVYQPCPPYSEKSPLNLYPLFWRLSERFISQGREKLVEMDNRPDPSMRQWGAEEDYL